MLLPPLTTKSSRSPLAHYIRDCRSLHKDIGLLIDDLRFQIDKKGSIYYAVDFSEIHAYIVPEDSAHTMKLLTYDDDELAQVIQHRALSRLLLKAPRKPLLLEPYLIELKSWIDRIRRKNSKNLPLSLPRHLLKLAL